MNKKEFRSALKKLHLTQGEVAVLCGKVPRTGRKWANEELPIPHLTAVMLRGLLSGKYTIDDVEEWGKCP